MRIINHLLILMIVLGLGVQAARGSDLSDASYRVMMQQLLHEARVVELLRDVPELIDQEIDNLKATPLPLTNHDLIQIRYELERRLAVAELKKVLQQHLNQEFDENELRQVRDLLQRPEVLRFKQLQSDMAHESMRQAIRNYKAKVRDEPPRGKRVELMQALSDSTRYGKLETDLKVELRKNLLMSVSWIKSRELIREDVLERELVQYRHRVSEQIQDDTLYHMLFMFKRTPSPQLQKLIDTYSAPELERFLKTCHLAIKDAFVQARAQAADDMKLAASP